MFQSSPFASRDEDNVCASMVTVTFVFENIFVLSLLCVFALLPSHASGTLMSVSNTARAMWRGETQMRSDYIYLPFSLSLPPSLSLPLHLIAIHVIGASCLSGNSPSGTLDFVVLLNILKKKTVTNHHSTRCHVEFADVLHVTLFHFLKSQRTGAL